MIIFDEKKYAEDIIANGYKNEKYITGDNIILVKYWKYKGLNEKEIKKKLNKLMDKFQYLYNSKILESKIKRAMNVGMKYELVTDKIVEIFDKEIELINQLETIEQRKMMFVLLVVWKFRGAKSFRITNKDLMDLAKIKLYNKAFWDNIFLLTQSGMLSMKQYRNKDYYVVNIKEEGKVVIKIGNYRNLIYYYLALSEPEKYNYCKQCSAPIKLTSNRKMYCRECWKEIRREQQREWDRINRKSDN